MKEPVAGPSGHQAKATEGGKRRMKLHPQLNPIKRGSEIASGEAESAEKTAATVAVAATTTAADIYESAEGEGRFSYSGDGNPYRELSVSDADDEDDMEELMTIQRKREELDAHIQLLQKKKLMRGELPERLQNSSKSSSYNNSNNRNRNRRSSHCSNNNTSSYKKSSNNSSRSSRKKHNRNSSNNNNNSSRSSNSNNNSNSSSNNNDNRNRHSNPIKRRDVRPSISLGMRPKTWTHCNLNPVLKGVNTKIVKINSQVEELRPRRGRAGGGEEGRRTRRRLFNMAPFKLKFRMGGSRSTSQEVDSDPQVNEALLNHSTTIGASSSTIDSADCTSLGSMGNERKSLLPNKTNNLRLGYLNPTITQCTSESPVPKSPPPSYEHVLEENTRLANSLDLGSRLTLSAEDGCAGGGSIEQSSNIRSNSTGRTSCEQIASHCMDPDCSEIGGSNEHISEDAHNNNSQQIQIQHNDDEDDDENEPDNRKESIDSTEYLISRMTAPSSEENLLDDCSGSACHSSNNSGFCDPLMHNSHHHHASEQQDLDCSYHEESQNQPPPEYSENPEAHQSDSESEGGWDSNQMSQMSGNYSQQQERSMSPEIISNKSSKEIYKAVAKQWGITCKMSDQCRCMECQSHYFDCEYDDNEHQKTDGGLGAGTPMFISEVMQGSACTIL